jgi:tRNA 2-thiouridine synthesizing protein A
MAGLDPAIHLSKGSCEDGWMRGPSPRRRGFGPAGGSSPRMTQQRYARLTMQDRFAIFAAMAQTKLDLTGLKCPLPALKTRKALKSLKPGDRLEVHCTDPLSVIDIPNLIRETGDTVEIAEQGERRFVFLIEKSNGESPAVAHSQG